jgi:hypothetical protein
MQFVLHKYAPENGLTTALAAVADRADPVQSQSSSAV